MTYSSSNSSDPKVEQITDATEDESSTESFEIEFIPISTTDKLLKKMRERWWVFFETTLPTITTDRSASNDNPTFSGGVFGPVFSGHRFVLGGDKTTH
jgi:hypothetical protein